MGGVRDSCVSREVVETLVPQLSNGMRTVVIQEALVGHESSMRSSGAAVSEGAWERKVLNAINKTITLSWEILAVGNLANWQSLAYWLVKIWRT